MEIKYYILISKKSRQWAGKEKVKVEKNKTEGMGHNAKQNISKRFLVW